MKLEVYEKTIPIKFVKLGDEEYRLEDVIVALSDMIEETREGDRYGDYSLRDYELSADVGIYKWFVEQGIFKNYTGSRMANLFCLAEGKRDEAKELRDQLWEMSD